MSASISASSCAPRFRRSQLAGDPRPRGVSKGSPASWLLRTALCRYQLINIIGHLRSPPQRNQNVYPAQRQTAHHAFVRASSLSIRGSAVSRKDRQQAGSYRRHCADTADQYHWPSTITPSAKPECLPPSQRQAAHHAFVGASLLAIRSCRGVRPSKLTPTTTRKAPVSFATAEVMHDQALAPCRPQRWSRASMTVRRKSPITLIDRESWPNTISATPC